MEEILIVRPSTAHSAYKVAADSFAELAARIADTDVDILTDDASLPDDSRPIVILGSDAVNHLSAKLYFERVVDGFDIRYNTDDYSIISAQWKNHQVLFLSGGRPRAAIYAVYRYFELFCGCRYFWTAIGFRVPAHCLSTISTSPNRPASNIVVCAISRIAVCTASKRALEF